MTGVLAIAAIVWLYAPTGLGLAREWLESSDTSYGIILAAVAATIAWRRRTLFVSHCDARSSPLKGLAALTIALALFLAGSLGADVFLTRVSLITVLAATSYFLAGPAATRVVAAPLAMLLMAIPPPMLVVNTITLPLQLLASRIAEGMLMTVGIPVFREGNLLQLPSATLEVVEACSGLRSLVSLSALAALLAWATEPTLPRRAAIVAAAVPITVVANGARIAFTGAATEAWGPHILTGPWHSFTGWVTFMGSLTVLLLVRRLLDLTRDTRRVITPSTVGA